MVVSMHQPIPSQQTPLHYAAANQELEILQYLLNNFKVDINAKDATGKV